MAFTMKFTRNFMVKLTRDPDGRKGLGPNIRLDTGPAPGDERLGKGVTLVSSPIDGAA